MNLLMTYFIFMGFLFNSHVVNDLNGIWLTEKGDSKIQITKTNNSWAGKVVWLKEPNTNEGVPKTDKNNPDPSKNKQSIIGLTVLNHLLYNEGKYSGIIYSPEKGKVFDCIISFKDSDHITIKVKAGIFSKEIIWSRQL